MNHSEKIRQSKKDFAEVLTKLSDMGTMACIKKVGPMFNCIVNFEIKASFKTRRACRNYLKKLV